MTKLTQDPIFSWSRFLARLVVKNPNIWNEALEFNRRHSVWTVNDHLQVLKNLSNTPQVRLTLLHHYKYTHFLRITHNDFTNTPPEVTMAELSDLAEALLRIASQDLLTLSPLPKPKGDYSLIAMGKLGGRELNYSSDIDLIALCEFSEDHEYYVRHIQKLTSLFTDITEEGFLFRVDWELRPEGRAGPLINSLTAMMTYYESFGADWERQAYTRARPVAGNDTLGYQFLKLMDPFIYRRSIDFNSLQSLQILKQKFMAEALKKNKDGFHVKLGVGGIREIEFFVQAFLVLYGGKIPELKITQTLQGLTTLVKHNFITSTEADFLKSSYLFLRQIEHRLQMREERQTHTLPANTDERQAVAASLNFENSEAGLVKFDLELENITTGVHQLYSSLFTPTTIQTEKTNTNIDHEVSYREKLQTLLNKDQSIEEQLDTLRFFKKREFSLISQLEEQKIERQTILEKISLVAEAICQEALILATTECEKIFGKPVASNQEDSKSASHLLTLAMGKLGGREINYASDLDLVFLFTESGTTIGPRQVTNGEYFARLAQKFITYLSVTTRAGTGFEIDTELRPSGNQGILVTTLNSFFDYQNNVAAFWEKQSLTRARPFLGPPPYLRYVENKIFNKLYSSHEQHPLLKKNMFELRMRVEKELARETTTEWDFKKGLGGLMDIEFIVQYWQLIYGNQHTQLHARNIFDLLLTIKELPLDASQIATDLYNAYEFYRTLESHLQLKLNRSVTKIHQTGPLADEIDERMTLHGHSHYREQWDHHRKTVRQLFKSVLEGN